MQSGRRTRSTGRLFSGFAPVGVPFSRSAGAVFEKRAFTLMEVMVALVVLGTALVLLSQGLTAAIRSSARAERTTRAATVADEIFQRMESGEIDLLAENEGTLDAFVEQTAGVELAEQDVWQSAYRWRSDVSEWTVEGLYQVTLTVAWTDAAFDSNRTFEAVRLFYVPPEDEEEGESGSQSGGTSQ